MYKKILIVVLIFIIAIVGVVAYFSVFSSEVKVYNNSEDKSLKTYNDNNLSFKYKENLNTQYIFTQEWPPVIKMETGTYSCEITPQEKSSMLEITSQRLVDNRIYCVNVKNEGTAGSVYSSYTYTTTKGGKLVTVSFVLRYPNCNNYDADQSKLCTNEREAFDIDAMIDGIVQTIKF